MASGHQGRAPDPMETSARRRENGREVVTRVSIRRGQGEPLRLATLAILFAATMVAAVLVPRQIRAALAASAVTEADTQGSRVGADVPWVWPDSANAAPAAPLPAPHGRRHHHNRSGCAPECVSAATDRRPDGGA